MRQKATAVLTGFLILATVGLLAPAPPAAAGGIVRQVATEAELRDALTDAEADDSGPHRILFTADIDIGPDALEYSGDQDLTIAGQDHELRGTGAGLLVASTSATVTISGLTLTGTAFGVSAQGSVVVRNSTFLHLGVGHPLAIAHGAISAGRGSPAFDLLVVDSRFIGNRAFSRALVSARRIDVVRSRFVDNVTSQALISGGEVDLRGSQVLGTRTPTRSVIEAEWGSLTLTRSLVAGTVVGAQARPTLDAYRSVIVLDRSIIRDNGSSGPHRYGVAISSVRLRAHHSVVRHSNRACWVTDSSVWVASLASDRSCRFP